MKTSIAPPLNQVAEILNAGQPVTQEKVMNLGKTEEANSGSYDYSPYIFLYQQMHQQSILAEFERVYCLCMEGPAGQSSPSKRAGSYDPENHNSR